MISSCLILCIFSVKFILNTRTFDVFRLVHATINPDFEGNLEVGFKKFTFVWFFYYDVAIADF